MLVEEIGNIRLHNQQIAGTSFTTAQEMVGWMGAMQAQDYNMAKWAIGARLPHATDKQIETALDNGEILRTHVLRPTWHLISGDDIYWLLELSASKIKTELKSRLKQLELTTAVVAKSKTILEKALANNSYLTREALVTEMQQSGIPTDNNRASHLLLCAELDCIICSGPTKNHKQTYALLPERVPQRQIFAREEALEKLAQIYFSSHGPATLQDFTWWSGLSITDARKALELVKPSFISATIGSATYWFRTESANFTSKPGSAFLLPAFDEFIISYKDRTASLLLEQHKKAISENGLFRPVVVIDGKVTGLWNRTMKKDKILLEINSFHPINNSVRSLMQKGAEKFGSFLEKDIEITIIN